MLAPPPRKTLKHLSRFGAPMVPVPIALNGHHTKNQHLIVSVAGIVGMCPLSCAMADFLSPAIVGMESFLQSAKSLKPRSCGLVDAGFCKDRLGSAIPATFVAGIADWKMWVVRVWENCTSLCPCPTTLRTSEMPLQPFLAGSSSIPVLATSPHVMHLHVPGVPHMATQEWSKYGGGALGSCCRWGAGSRGTCACPCPWAA